MLIVKNSFLHALRHLLVYEGTLGVHHDDFVIDAIEDIGDGIRDGDHAHCYYDLGQVAAGYDNRGLLFDATLDMCWALVDELDGAFVAS